jgi:hypothetical protein
MVSAGLVVRLLRLARLFRSSLRAQALVQSLQTMVPFLLRFCRLVFFVALLFAVVGVAAFGGTVFEASPAVVGTPYDPANGKYSYLPMNFNDVASGLVVLLALLVVNNWFEICDQFVAASGTEWARLFFVCWWVVGVCVLLNVLVSFVLEVFVSEFARNQDAMHAQQRRGRSGVLDASQLHAVDSIDDAAGATLIDDEHGGPIFLKTSTQIDARFSE